jgi:hypothetical protein
VTLGCVSRSARCLQRSVRMAAPAGGGCKPLCADPDSSHGVEQAQEGLMPGIRRTHRRNHHDDARRYPGRHDVVVPIQQGHCQYAQADYRREARDGERKEPQIHQAQREAYAGSDQSRCARRQAVVRKRSTLCSSTAQARTSRRRAAHPAHPSVVCVLPMTETRRYTPAHGCSFSTSPKAGRRRFRVPRRESLHPRCDVPASQCRWPPTPPWIAGHEPENGERSSGSDGGSKPT